MRALEQHMPIPYNSALTSCFYIPLSPSITHIALPFTWNRHPLPVCWIPTCLYLESHWECLTKTNWRECENVPLALSPRSGAVHLTSSRSLGHAGPSELTWRAQRPPQTSPLSFRLLSSHQASRSQFFLSAFSHQSTLTKKVCVFSSAAEMWKRTKWDSWAQLYTGFSPRRAHFILLSRWPWAGCHGNISIRTLRGVSAAVHLWSDKALSPQNREKRPKAKGWK